MDLDGSGAYPSLIVLRQPGWGYLGDSLQIVRTEAREGSLAKNLLSLVGKTPSPAENWDCGPQ